MEEHSPQILQELENQFYEELKQDCRRADKEARIIKACVVGVLVLDAILVGKTQLSAPVTNLLTQGANAILHFPGNLNDGFRGW